MGKKARNKRVAASVEAHAPTATAASADSRVALANPTIAGIAAALSVAVLAIFSQLRSHQFLTFDDPIYITNNSHVKAGVTMAGLRWAMTSLDFNWHPLTWFTHMLDVQLFGLDAGDHLLVNVALHLANTLLVLAFLIIGTGRIWRSGFVAGLFAVHPLHVESVAWIAERKDVLCAFFFLLGIVLHCRFVQTRSRLLYAVVIVSFVLGLMSKGMIITLPFVLLVVDYWPLQRWSLRDLRGLRPLILEKIPLFLLVIPAAVVTLAAQDHAKAITAHIGLTERLANAAISYVEYLVKTIWPADLAAFYPYRVVIAPLLAFGAILVLIAITAAVMQQAARRPYLPAGWFWFLGILVPVIGIVQIGRQSMADRYTYLPLIGIFIAITWLLADLVPSKVTIGAVGVTGILVLSILAHRQAGYWQDSIGLFSHALEVTPDNATAETLLGQAFLESADYTNAGKHFAVAAAMSPNDARVHNSLGLALSGLGDAGGAVREWKAAIAADAAFAEPYSNLGRIELGAGRKKEAEGWFEQSIQRDPAPRTFAELARARGDLDEAVRRYQQAIAADSQSSEIHNDYAATLAIAGRDQQAREEYETALRLSPGNYDADMNLGALLSRMGQNVAAVDHFRRAAQERPQSFEPHVYLALVLAQTGNRDAAIGEMQKAMAIDATSTNRQVLKATGGQFDGQVFIAGLQGQR